MPLQLKRTKIVGVMLSLMLIGCGEEHSKAPAAAQAHGAMSPAVTVVTAEQKMMQLKGEWSGRFEAPEVVEVRARVAGTIEHIHFHAGQKVKRGDLLFSLDARPFQAELERAQAQAAAAKTQLEFVASEKARTRKLLEAKAASQQELDQLNQQARSADAALKAAEAAAKIAKLNMEYTQIRSPIDGRVSRTAASVGNVIGVGVPVLTTLVSSDVMYVYFSISEQAYLKSAAHLHQKKAVTVWMGTADEQGTPHQGTLDFVDNRLNPNTGTVQVRAVFANPEGRWIPGLFARLSLPEGEPISAVVVPDRAIGTDQSKKMVWVVDAQNRAIPRDVKLGVLLDGHRIIEEGVKAGERVMVEGMQRVQPMMVVNPQPVQAAAAKTVQKD